MAPWVAGQLIIEGESERQRGFQGAQVAPGGWSVRWEEGGPVPPWPPLTWLSLHKPHLGPQAALLFPECLAHSSLRTLALTAASVCSPLP